MNRVEAYNPRMVNKLLTKLHPKSLKVSETELQIIIFDARDKLRTALITRNCQPGRARRLNINLYLRVFDCLCLGYNYDEMAVRLGVKSRGSVHFIVDWLRESGILDELKEQLKERTY